MREPKSGLVGVMNFMIPNARSDEIGWNNI
jgi:hypothetical protein